MTVTRLLAEADSRELTMWLAFLEARAEHLDEARQRAAWDAKYEG